MLFTFARKAAGALAHPAFPAPSIWGAWMIKARVGDVARLRLHVLRQCERAPRNDVAGAFGRLLLHCTTLAFTTLLRGNGLSAAFSVKVRDA